MAEIVDIYLSKPNPTDKDKEKFVAAIENAIFGSVETVSKEEKTETLGIIREIFIEEVKKKSPSKEAKEFLADVWDKLLSKIGIETERKKRTQELKIMKRQLRWALEGRGIKEENLSKIKGLRVIKKEVSGKASGRG